jgi:hypothetical protein
MAKTFEYAQAEEIRDSSSSRTAPSISTSCSPHGIERFEDALQRRVDVEGFPVCHPADIIASKQAANRAKDRESLPRLKAFLDYWREKHRG